MSIGKLLGVGVGGFLAFVASILTVIGLSLPDVYTSLTGPPSLDRDQRSALAAELRKVAVDGQISVDERAGLRERIAALGMDEEAARAYGAEIEPGILQAAGELEEGLRLATSGRFAEAHRRFAEAARLDAGNPIAWANLGGAALEVGSIAEAEAASRRALELDAKSAPAHYNLGACLARQERSEGALDHLALALDLVIDGATGPVDRKALLADLRGSPHFVSVRPLPRFGDLVRRLENADG